MLNEVGGRVLFWQTRPLIVESRYQQKQQGWVEDKAVEVIDEWSVIAWVIQFDDEVRDKKQKHAGELDPNREEQVFALDEKGVNQAQGKQVVQQEPNRPVDHKTLNRRVLRQPKQGCRVNLLKEKYRHKARDAHETDYESKNFLFIHVLPAKTFSPTIPKAEK